MSHQRCHKGVTKVISYCVPEKFLSRVVFHFLAMATTVLHGQIRKEDGRRDEERGDVEMYVRRSGAAEG